MSRGRATVVGAAAVILAALGSTAPPSAAVSISQKPLPEYQCGVKRCASAPATAILVDGSDRLLAAGVAAGDLYADVTPGQTLSVTGGPAGSPAYAIVIGPDGNPWVLSSLPKGKHAYAVVQDATPGGVVTRYEYSTAWEEGETPVAVAGGLGAVWLVDGAVDRLAPGGELTTLASPGSQLAGAMVAGPEESIWYTETGEGMIGQITPAGKVVLHPSEPGEGANPLQFSGPYGIAVGPDGRIWFAEANAGAIGRLGINGEIEQFAIPNHSPANASDRPEPHYLVAGPEGDMWFTDPGDDSIGRVTMAGEVTEYPIPSLTPVIPEEIVRMGNELVFNETNAVALGSVDPSGAPGEAPLSTPPPRATVVTSVSELISATTTAAKTALSHRHSFTLTFSPPEAGSLVIDLVAEQPKAPRAHKAATKTVLVAAGEQSFDLAEAEPLQVKPTSAGERLIRHSKRLWLTVRVTFTGNWAGAVEASEPLALHLP
jgi:streptogramin lyase